VRLRAEAGGRGDAYSRRMRRTYAVVWSENGSVASGRLESRADRFVLDGRGARLSIRFRDLTGAAIGRRQADRLRGLPVLALERGGEPAVRIASLQGTAALHELFEDVERSGVPSAPASGR
jgi:hypothetical protein